MGAFCSLAHSPPVSVLLVRMTDQMSKFCDAFTRALLTEDDTLAAYIYDIQTRWMRGKERHE